MENRITISICDEEYTFVAEEAPSYMQKVGSYVNDKMSELLDAAKDGRTDAAVLTAVNITDELFKEREAGDALRRQLKQYPRPGFSGQGRGQRAQARDLQAPAAEKVSLDDRAVSARRRAGGAVAAVQSGADAVYMGFGAFNARRSARNFSDEEFRAAVSYCHLREVQGLSDAQHARHRPRALRACRGGAHRVGVRRGRGVLVQDWGALATLQKIIPDVPLHASTQMSLHTLSGVQEAARLGMTRAVLARELSRGEIAEICQKSPIEIETFVHGALCMCYSGQCEMSAVIGRRSGNRGACAQPCRLPYGFSGRADGHPLSLKDANLAPLRAGDDGYGCRMPQDRRAHEAAGVCRRRDGDLPRGSCASIARRRRTSRKSSPSLSRATALPKATIAVCADERCSARGPKMQDGLRTGSARFARAMKRKICGLCRSH